MALEPPEEQKAQLLQLMLFKFTGYFWFVSETIFGLYTSTSLKWSMFPDDQSVVLEMGYY